MSYKNLCTIKAPQDIHQAFLTVKTQRKNLTIRKRQAERDFHLLNGSNT